MTAAIIGSPVNITFNAGTPSGTLTPGASNTHVAALVSYAAYDGAGITALTVGGNAFTKLIGANNSTNNTAYGEIWYYAGLSGSALTCAITTAATWKDVGITFISMSGTATPTVTNTDAHNAGTNLNAAVSCAVGDIIVAAAGCDRSGTAYGTWANSFTSDLNQASANSLCEFGTAHKVAAATTETANVAAGGSSATYSAALVVAVFPSGAAAATLSSPTPSGTLGTQTTATIGCTTNQNTGTFYCVVDSAANLSGVTAAQIKAGQKASGASALAAANSSVTTTTPSAGVTGLTANTLYSYSIVQNNANGDSNIVSGTFTTAVATYAASINLVNGSGSAYATTSFDWFAMTTYGVTLVGHGTTSTNGSGVLAVSGITASGAGYLTGKDTSTGLIVFGPTAVTFA